MLIQGGNTVDEFTVSILKAFLTDNMANLYSWGGRKKKGVGKYPVYNLLFTKLLESKKHVFFLITFSNGLTWNIFKLLHFILIITEAVLSQVEGATVKKIKNRIQLWLRQAKSRIDQHSKSTLDVESVDNNANEDENEQNYADNSGNEDEDAEDEDESYAEYSNSENNSNEHDSECNWIFPKYICLKFCFRYCYRICFRCHGNLVLI